MDELLRFEDRAAFRAWLSENCRTSGGIWLLFGKAGGPKTIKAGEALEEALCFGWIDGQMQSMGETAYKKYFSLRRAKSKWSEKNKALVQKLEEKGLINNSYVFFIQAKLYKAKMYAGTYTLNTAMTSEEMLRIIARKPEKSED